VIFNAGDVVVVPFPFTDRAATKRRPALVLSNRRFNDDHQQVVLAMITSTANAGWPSDTPIEDLKATGLGHDSIVRFKLFTLDRALVLRRTGALTNSARKALQDARARWLL
jgi:mRNA interferase MazF